MNCGTAEQRKRVPPFRSASFVLFDQFYGSGIDAVALARRAGAVGKDVAEVRVAAAAEHFLARHSVADVPVDLDFCFIDRRIEARPPGTGMKFRFRSKERLPATHTDIHARFLHVFVLSCARRLGAFLARHMILLWCEYLAPLRFALMNFFAHVGPRRNILASSGMLKKSLALGRSPRTESPEQKACTNLNHRPNGQEKSLWRPFCAPRRTESWKETRK